LAPGIIFAGVFASPREARAELRRTYDEDRWAGQPSFPILIVEKDTLEPVCRPLAEGWQMPFASSRGYGSLKLQHDVAEMLNHRCAQTGQEAVVYFASDLDPSGLDLQRAWEQALTAFGVRFVIVRVALTLEQVNDPALDIRRLGIEVKPSDSRSRGFIEQYGRALLVGRVRRCWEADILPANVIEQAIDRHINSWLDAKLWRRRDREIEAARKLL
jgi:hypothetical protein